MRAGRWLLALTLGACATRPMPPLPTTEDIIGPRPTTLPQSAIYEVREAIVERNLVALRMTTRELTMHPLLVRDTHRDEARDERRARLERFLEKLPRDARFAADERQIFGVMARQRLNALEEPTPLWSSTHVLADRRIGTLLRHLQPLASGPLRDPFAALDQRMRDRLDAAWERHLQWLATLGSVTDRTAAAAWRERQLLSEARGEDAFGDTPLAPPDFASTWARRVDALSRERPSACELYVDSPERSWARIGVSIEDAVLATIPYDELVEHVAYLAEQPETTATAAQLSWLSMRVKATTRASTGGECPFVLPVEPVPVTQERVESIETALIGLDSLRHGSIIDAEPPPTEPPESPEPRTDSEVPAIAILVVMGLVFAVIVYEWRQARRWKRKR